MEFSVLRYPGASMQMGAYSTVEGCATVNLHAVSALSYLPLLYSPQVTFKVKKYFQVVYKSHSFIHYAIPGIYAPQFPALQA